MPHGCAAIPWVTVEPGQYPLPDPPPADRIHHADHPRRSVSPFMLQKIRIGPRLVLSFGLLLALIGALAVIGISGASQLTARSAALYTERTVPLGALAEISELTQRNRALVMDMLMDPGTSNLQASHAAITANVARIRALWQTYASQPFSLQEQQQVDAFAALNEAYLDNGLVPAAAALLGGRYDDGSELYLTQIRPTAARVQQAAEGLVTQQIQGGAAEFDAARALSESIHTWMVGAAALALLAGAALALVITRSIARPLRDAVAVARTVASGDLSATIEVRGADETADLLEALRDMNRQLVGVISEVRDTTETVAREANQIAHDTTDLARRTEIQASSLQETAASMEQLTITVQHNADNASRATTAAGEARLVAEAGRSVMHEVVATMQGIDSQSRRIADIIKVIDDIAFQTNLLALNAAVEAARAGEHGRGFAVVAGEVRGLSQRSSAAAREIRELITDSVRNVERGSALVSQAGQRVSDTVTHMQQVVALIDEIQQASQEQARGISQMGEAVRLLDSATQQNATLVDHHSAASTGMRGQVQRLVEAVRQFRLTAAADAPRLVAHTVSPQAEGPYTRLARPKADH